MENQKLPKSAYKTVRKIFVNDCLRHTKNSLESHGFGFNSHVYEDLPVIVAKRMRGSAERKLLQVKMAVIRFERYVGI